MTNNYTSQPAPKHLKPKKQTIDNILNFSRAYRVIKTNELSIELLLN